MNTNFDTLNDEQKLAVYSNAPKVLCLAGAGTGKSRVLISRIERLIAEGVEPQSILALTFTNVAAREMQLRFSTRENNDEDSNCPEFYTFHSFCYSIMCEPKIYRHFGYKEAPSIIEDDELKEMFKTATIQTGVKLPESKLKCCIDELNPQDQLKREKFDLAMHRLFIKDSTITFDTLINCIVGLFKEQNRLVKLWLEKFKYILVDEMQDTDVLQYEFIQSFPNAQLFVVGDALQNLYSFRGTTSEIIKGLANNPEWLTYKLTKNYRCNSKICDYANKIAESYSDKSYRVVMESMNEGDDNSLNISTSRANLDDIKKLMSRDGTSAILCRTNKEADTWRDILYDANIGYHSNKVCDYRYNILMSVLDAEYFMTWTANEFLTASKYDEYIRWKLTNSDKDITDLSGEYLDKFLSPLRYDATIVKVMGLMKALIDLLLESDLDTEDKLANLVEMLSIEIPEGSDISDFIEYPENDGPTVLNLTNIVEALKDDKPTADCCGLESIYVGTIHSAKGLEYDNVLIPNVGSKSFQLDNEDNLNCYYVAITRAKQYLEIHYDLDRGIEFEYE